VSGRPLATVGLFLLLGCAHAPPPAASLHHARASTGDTLSVRGVASPLSVRVTGDEVLGMMPEVGIARDGRELRGQALGAPVMVGIGVHQAAGVFRTGPVDVRRDPGSNGLVVAGLFGGVAGLLALSPERFNGNLGACSWDLRWDGKAYAGSRDCGPASPMSVELPASLAGWSDLEVGTVLGLLLAGALALPVEADLALAGGAPEPELDHYLRLAADPRAAGRSQLPATLRPGRRPIEIDTITKGHYSAE
jgi:hypothetical protein